MELSLALGAAHIPHEPWQLPPGLLSIVLPPAPPPPPPKKRGSRPWTRRELITNSVEVAIPFPTPRMTPPSVWNVLLYSSIPSPIWESHPPPQDPLLWEAFLTPQRRQWHLLSAPTPPVLPGTSTSNSLFVLHLFPLRAGEPLRDTPVYTLSGFGTRPGTK